MGDSVSVEMTIADARKFVEDLQKAAQGISAFHSERLNMYVPQKNYWEIPNEDAALVEYAEVEARGKKTVLMINESMMLVYRVKTLIQEVNNKKNSHLFQEVESAENALRLIAIYKQMLRTMSFLYTDDTISANEYAAVIMAAKEVKTDEVLSLDKYMPEAVSRAIGEEIMQCKGAIRVLEGALAIHNTQNSISFEIPEVVLNFCNEKRIVVPGVTF